MLDNRKIYFFWSNIGHDTQRRDYRSPGPTPPQKSLFFFIWNPQIAQKAYFCMLYSHVHKVVEISSLPFKNIDAEQKNNVQFRMTEICY